MQLGIWAHSCLAILLRLTAPHPLHLLNNQEIRGLRAQEIRFRDALGELFFRVLALPFCICSLLCTSGFLSSPLGLGVWGFLQGLELRAWTSRIRFGGQLMKKKAEYRIILGLKSCHRLP